MKIRNGFISNSSASSFIVKYKDSLPRSPNSENKVELSDKDIRELKTFGFFPTDEDLPIRLLMRTLGTCEPPPKGKGKVYSYAYYVNCNEEEVIQFLIQKRISFAASTCYGTKSVIYDSKKDEIVIAQNFGISAEFYGRQDITEPYKRNLKPYKIMKGKDYLAGNE